MIPVPQKLVTVITPLGFRSAWYLDCEGVHDPDDEWMEIPRKQTFLEWLFLGPRSTRVRIKGFFCKKCELPLREPK